MYKIIYIFFLVFVLLLSDCVYQNSQKSLPDFPAVTPVWWHATVEGHFAGYGVSIKNLKRSAVTSATFDAKLDLLKRIKENLLSQKDMISNASFDDEMINKKINDYLKNGNLKTETTTYFVPSINDDKIKCFAQVVISISKILSLQEVIKLKHIRE